MQAGEALESSNTATTVAVKDGERIITDGPFAETREVLGGYYLVDVPDLDAAIDWAARCPGAKYGSASRSADHGVRDCRERVRAPASVEAVFREEWGRLLAALVRTLGDLDLAEEVASDAVAAACARWPRTGCPTRPARGC